jgi:uncharacterized membrane protein (DUF2068 family)
MHLPSEFHARTLKKTIARVSNLSCQRSGPESQSLMSPLVERAAEFRLAANLGVRGVAIIEGAKGLVVLLVGFGLMSLVHHDVERFVVGIVRHIHLNPASHYPRIFIQAAASATDARLWFLSLAALLYAAVRFIEAYGLWYQRHWAEVFAVVTGAIYLPVEIYELVERVSSVRIVIFAANSLIVAYLSCTWWQRNRRER